MQTPPFSGFDRKRYIDWLRIIAVLLLIPFHTAMVFFEYESFYVKGSETHPLINIFVFLLSPWHMPLLFLLAGMSSYYATLKRTDKEYFIERTRRLLIPLIFGIFIIVPPQPYFAYLKHEPNTSFLQFISQYFTSIKDNFTGYNGSFTPAHLWFILYLYIFSILSIPLFSILRKRSESIDKKISKHSLLLLYPIISGLAEQIPFFSDKNPFYYYTYFIIGFFIASHESIEHAIYKEKDLSLYLGIITMSTYIIIISIFPPFAKYSTMDVLFYILRRFNSWFWLIWILSYSKKYLHCTSKGLQYLTEASYPIYLIHQTIIVVVAYYVIQWNINIWHQFFIIILFSVILIFVIYHFIIGKYKILRFLFGMR
ncbi:MAG TPA: acyltransferase family protein [Candidatus Hydrogenedens sp.]|nr:acyltransferase family protein [Candidatus Hydrogenedens sp.]HOL19302.1 acyltransferase family protein [Candidatus Hydrogenedens sp.]HPP59255.1 acyltransferase family protein [Candidatus Hydrogenedens sp.]